MRKKHFNFFIIIFIFLFLYLMTFFNGLFNWFNNLTPILYYQQRSFEISAEVSSDTEKKLYNSQRIYESLAEQTSVLRADGDTYFFELEMSFNRKETVFFCKQHKQLYTEMLNGKAFTDSDYDNLIKFESFRIYRNFVNIFGIRTVFFELDKVVKEGDLAKLVFRGYLIRKSLFGSDTSKFPSLAGFRLLSGITMADYLKLYETWKCGQIYFFCYDSPLDNYSTDDDVIEQWYYRTDEFLSALFYIDDVEYPIVLNRIIFYAREVDCTFHPDPHQCVFEYGVGSDFIGKNFCYSNSLICDSDIDKSIYDYFCRDADFGHRLRLNNCVEEFSRGYGDNDSSLFYLFLYAFDMKRFNHFFIRYEEDAYDHRPVAGKYAGSSFYYRGIFYANYFEYYRSILREVPRYNKTFFNFQPNFNISYLFFFLCSILIIYFMFSDVHSVHAEGPQILYSVLKKEIFDCYLYSKGIPSSSNKFIIYNSCHLNGLFKPAHYWIFDGNYGAVLTHSNFSEKIYGKHINLLVSNLNIDNKKKSQYFGHFLKFYQEDINYNLNDFFKSLINFHPETQTSDDKHYISFYNLKTKQALVTDYIKKSGNLLHDSFYTHKNKNLGDNPYDILDRGISDFKLSKSLQEVDDTFKN